MSRSLAEDERRRTALMREAHAVQQHLLPRAVDIPGLQTATLFLPAEGVAGDYYDFLPLRDGTWVICIADVMGHGVPAAMGAAIFKTLLTTAVEQHVRPAEVLDFINRRFSQALPTGYFASAFVGRWLPDGRLLEYSSAGHVPGLLWGASGTTRTLPSTGLFVGLDERAVWETERCSIGCREQLLLFTDGVTEALSPSHELFGMERLVSCLDPRRDCPPDETVQVIRQAVAEHHGGRPWSDDCTLLVLEGSCTDAACGCRARAGGAGLLSA
jgi:serine phosphatase RsbU (regulator of sigma subunit)